MERPRLAKLGIRASVCRLHAKWQFRSQTDRRTVALRLDKASGHQSVQMADPDDAAALQELGESTSAPPADQSLRAPATATATGGCGSAEERTSGVLKLAAGDSGAGAAEPNQAGESSRDRDAIPRSPLESTLEELARTALRLELAQLQHALEEEPGEGEEVHVGDDVAVTAAVADNGETESTAYRVIEFGGGTYRGQVQARGAPEQREWQPHGLGVLKTAAGHTCCGQWRNGTQASHGTRYSPTLRYEGDFGAGSTAAASFHGVGLYTFGALFVGCWDARVAGHVHPRGLGTLQSSTGGMSVDGWFHGLRCVHRCPSDADKCAVKLSSSLRSQPQPQRGLIVADEKLQHWRRHVLTRAWTTWTRLCCEFSATQARRSRLLALQAQAQARRAEQRAISEHLERQKAAKSQDAAELLNLLAESREAQEQRSQRRQLYAQRLAGAFRQRDLAQACVTKQDGAVKTLELELQEVVGLLKEARQAQAHCAQYVRELHVLKRQIENASVKLNAARFEQQRQETSQHEHPQPSLSQRSVPPTPMKMTPRQRGNAGDKDSVPHSRGGSSITIGQQYVCDVPGCLCGIPRDVFLRVAAALNDE
ncbi:hypothetical protein PHYPSEUDO_010658 [Phytophthora pseudosyringae]|uniref:Uncharacterized protein n=1 Tax=Phytophthora pseudosyringae TaxID=221518 RepID=A0A8T1WB94_9STRA|nr:hypothetical protein PHYPSEUDO_010658 [Phytophthora pseudosyringae]